MAEAGAVRHQHANRPGVGLPKERRREEQQRQEVSVHQVFLQVSGRSAAGEVDAVYGWWNGGIGALDTLPDNFV